MGLATAPTTMLTPTQERLYMSLAAAALQSYPIVPTTTQFIQHNAGIVFRVEAQDQHAYVLKLHKRVGMGDDPSAAQLEAGLEWLAACAQHSDIVLQVPVRTRAGTFVAQLHDPAVAQPIACTLQTWSAGEPPHADFTDRQAYQLGVLLARLHTCSRSYPLSPNVPAMRHDSHELLRNVQVLRSMLPPELLSTQDFETILATQERILAHMDALGSGTAVWGPVHGDLHYDNVVCTPDAVYPIDFTGLRLGYYLYDMAVTLYHCFHQEPAFREAFFAGYRQEGTLPPAYQPVLECFIAYAAIDNLAWNSTIPEQIPSALFQKNLRQLVLGYCLPIIRGEGFLFR